MDIDWTLFTGVDIRGEGEDPAELVPPLPPARARPARTLVW